MYKLGVLVLFGPFFKQSQPQMSARWLLRHSQPGTAPQCLPYLVTHTIHPQIHSALVLFSALSAGGLYLCECFFQKLSRPLLTLAAL